MPVQPRTYEGHMDWEFADSRGPVDPRSPFTQLAGQNNFTGSFATPVKPQTPQAPPSTSKTPYYTPQPPSAALFAPHITRTNTAKASPFRNPAFTTPRKAFDDTQLSEAESSPGNLTDEYGADISELADQSRDFEAEMKGALGPTRVDKTARHRAPARERALSVKRLHMSGKGEIGRHPRDLSARDVLRKRRRHGPDKDVSESVRGWGSDESGSESEPGMRKRTRKASGGRLGRVSRIGSPGGPLSMFFAALDRYPNAPETLTKWGLFLLNATVLGVGVWFVWGIVGGIRHDMAQGIRAELDAVRAKVASCTADFKANNCDSPLPALRIQCAEWGNCMMDSPEAHLRFKIFAKQFAEIINEFSNTMHLKGWAFFFAVFLLILSLNVFGRRNIPHIAPPPYPQQPTPQAQHHDMPQPSPYPHPHPHPHFGMWVPGQQGMHGIGHPSLFGGANRPAFEVDEATDTGAESPDTKHRPMLQPPPQTPSRRHGPSKQYHDWERERSRSPTKRSAIGYR